MAGHHEPKYIEVCLQLEPWCIKVCLLQLEPLYIKVLLLQLEPLCIKVCVLQVKLERIKVCLLLLGELFHSTRGLPPVLWKVVLPA